MFRTIVPALWMETYLLALMLGFFVCMNALQSTSYFNMWVTQYLFLWVEDRLWEHLLSLYFCSTAISLAIFSWKGPIVCTLGIMKCEPNSDTTTWSEDLLDHKCVPDKLHKNPCWDNFLPWFMIDRCRKAAQPRYWDIGPTESNGNDRIVMNWIYSIIHPLIRLVHVYPSSL